MNISIWICLSIVDLEYSAADATIEKKNVPHLYIYVSVINKKMELL